METTVEPVHVAAAATPAQLLPERLSFADARVLALADAGCALAALAVGTLLGGDVRGALAAVLIVVIAAYFSGRYRRSFALRPRDEIYSAIAVAVEAAPFLIVATFLFDTTPAADAFAFAVISAGMLFTGYACARQRRGNAAFEASMPYVTRAGRTHARSAPVAIALRALDVIAGTIATLLLLPVMAVCAVAIMIDSGNPVIFKQQRIGRDDRTFTMYKFRTMTLDAGNDWVKPGDARITRSGAFLRRTSLDELPQLFNVLAGDMSLVGPRPEMPDYAAIFETQLRNYPDRHIVRPGITGWAQLHCPRNLQPSDIPPVLGHDLFYVENAGVHLYVLSLVQTAFEVLFQHAV